jgi:PAS domain S-box-containing protein
MAFRERSLIEPRFPSEIAGPTARRLPWALAALIGVSLALVAYAGGSAIGAAEGSDGAILLLGLCGSLAGIGALGLLQVRAMRRANAALKGELAAAGSRLRLSAAAAGVADWSWDPARDTISWSPELEDLYGLSRGHGPTSQAGFLALIHPEDRARVAEALQRALAGEDFETEFRILPSDGRQRWIATKGRLVQDDGDRRRRLVGVSFDISARKRAESALTRSRAELRQAAEAAGLTYAEADLVAGRFSWADNYAAVMGFAPPGGPGAVDLAAARAAFLDHVGPADRGRVAAALQAFHAGEAIGPVEYRLRGDDGRERWIETRWTMAAGEDGRPLRTFSTSLDVTQHKQAEEQIRLLMDEVNHRAKNLLAVVQSITRLTVRDSPPEAFAEDLVHRLQSLGASQDLIVRAGWQGVDLAHLARAQLDHLGGAAEQQVAIAGPPLTLQPTAAQGIGMALHELATNALKYGALSMPAGRVQVGWSLADEPGPVFRMHWIERGGPPVSPPRRRGFGHTVVERMAARAVDGSVSLRFDPEGVRWQLEAPADRLLHPAGEAIAQPDPTGGPSGGRGG